MILIRAKFRNRWVYVLASDSRIWIGDFMVAISRSGIRAIDGRKDDWEVRTCAGDVYTKEYTDMYIAYKVIMILK